MPIKPELKGLYPADWPAISDAIRFGRAKGRCERCKRPHGKLVEVTRNGRWCEGDLWRDDRGHVVGAPEGEPTTFTMVYTSAAHLDHNPATRSRRALKALCQRCHLDNDREEHQRRRRMTSLQRLALGDLFSGPYEA